jgi:hypothetical protein
MRRILFIYERPVPCRSRFATHAHNENASLSNGRIFKGWIFEFRAAQSVICTLIVRYAMTLCPEACCSGRVSIATAIDFILAGLYCERLSIAT